MKYFKRKDSSTVHYRAVHNKCNRVYHNVKKLSKSLCLLIYIGPIYMQPISAKKMIFGAFSSLGHLFLVFGLLRG